MNNEQNTFYTSISTYYSEIFPYRPMQLRFVKKGVGELEGKSLLDIGCATGELAYQLANSGANLIGIDLNEKLLAQAKTNKKHPNLVFQTGNMLELKNDFQIEQFDTILCFGNTLVHLPAVELIKHMLNGVFAVLKPGGQFFLQILNYDYILDKKLAELPLIETDNIRFVRKYKFKKSGALIRFITDLHIKKENETISNQTTLLALKSNRLIELLKEAGFSDIQLFSNFKQETFGGKHLPMVLSCRKYKMGLL